LGSKSIFLNQSFNEEADLTTTSWNEIYQFLKSGMRKARVYRKTNETEIEIEVNIDGKGKSEISTDFTFLIICWIRLPDTEIWILRSK
jgi:imidazoleglycerol-phosphate dehydratase/histidinol-phosphatase